MYLKLIWYCICFSVLSTVTGLYAGESEFVEVTYYPSDEIFVNPERGFYSWREGRVNTTPLGISDLRSIRNNLGHSLIIRLYYLPEFRDKDLSQSMLDLMQTDFDRLREAGLKAILRFRYSKSETEQDAPLEIVERHLDQLRPSLHENYDVIAVMQAGFIGAWGEWHASSNNLTTLANKKAVLNKILEIVPENRMTQLRYPSDKMNIFSTNQPLTTEQAFDGSDISRTGHHNDCFLASNTDVGTYRISPVYEKNYLNLDTRYVPMGGETCRVREGDRYKCESALVELAQMRWSYLNSAYYRGILDTWTSEGCMDEVKMRLGYRFELIHGKYNRSAHPGGSMNVELSVYNYGWAAPFNPRRFEVLLRSQENGNVYYVQLPDDPRLWLGGDTVAISAELGIPAEMTPGDYELLVHFPDPAKRLYGRPEYSIRLGNEQVWEPETGFNTLLHVVEIKPEQSGEPYQGELIFREWSKDVVSVNEFGSDLPSRTHLIGNYPNPFNPSTTIQYELSEQAYIRLSVYNVLGQKVVKLVDAVQDAGEYKINFKASGLSSGLYLYRLSTGSFVETRSMILLQ